MSNPRYFDRFPGFSASHAAPIVDEMDRLAQQKQWTAQERYSRLVKAYKAEWTFFASQLSNGTNDELDILQELCRTLEVEEGTSLTACRKALRTVRVSIVDLLDGLRADEPIHPVFRGSNKRSALVTHVGRDRRHRVFPKQILKGRTALDEELSKPLRELMDEVL